MYPLMNRNSGSATSTVGSRRRASRLAAVQALYQIALCGEEPNDAMVEDAIIEFLTYRLGAELPEDSYAEVDNEMFSDLVRGTFRQSVRLIEILDRVLPDRWKFAKLDKILAKILGCAAYEMQFRVDVPVAVIINEYVEITKAFYEGDEGGFINGVLQEVAENLRGDEVLEHRNERARSK